MTTFTTLKAFESAVRKTVKQEGNLRDKYQSYGIHALTHYKEHGDQARMAALINIMTEESPYRKLIFSWIKKYCPVKVTKGNDDKIKFIKHKGTPADTDVEGATNEPFWTINGMPGMITFDLFSVVEKALEQYDLASSGDKDRVNKYVAVSRDDRALLQRMVDHKSKAKTVTLASEVTGPAEALNA